MFTKKFNHVCVHRIYPKCSNIQVWANSADPDQTAPKGAVWSGSSLFADPSQHFRRIHDVVVRFTLRKHAYSNILKHYHQKMKIFRRKILIFFIFLLKNRDCGYSLEPPRRGGSNEYPQSMSLSRNMKNNVYPCKPQFYYIKVGFKGVKII